MWANRAWRCSTWRPVIDSLAMRISVLIPICAWICLAQPSKVLTPQEIFRRNTEPRDQMNQQFPPHKIAGNLYYVGTPVLSSFLIRHLPRWPHQTG
jgi:hypothetical protein